MWNKLFDYYFWFTQPATILNNSDRILGYIFLGLLIIAIVLRILVWKTQAPINRQLFRKLWNLTFTIALTGVIWFGLRYENVPIFAERFWAALDLLVGVIWLVFVLKYLVLSYPKQKSEYSRMLIKEKYLPKSK